MVDLRSCWWMCAAELLKFTVFWEPFCSNAFKELILKPSVISSMGQVILWSLHDWKVIVNTPKLLFVVQLK